MISPGAEAQKSFRHGFILNKDDVKELFNFIESEMRGNSNNITTRIQIKLKNGIVLNTSSIDEVVDHGNSALGTIISIVIELQDKPVDPLNIISLNFVNVRTEQDSVSICYFVRGEDHRWVFNVSQHLEERVKEIKVFSPNQLTTPRNMFIFSTFIPVILAGIMSTLLFFMATLFPILYKSPVIRLEQQWENGTIKDPIKAIIFLEKEKNSRRFIKRHLKNLGILVGVPGLIISLILGLILFVQYFSPAYNFCWGGYLRLYERRRKIRKFVLSSILAATLTSVIAGIIVLKFFQ